MEHGRWKHGLQSILSGALSLTWKVCYVLKIQGVIDMPFMPPKFYDVREDSEQIMAPHSSTFAWKIPWTEEPGGLQSMGFLEIRHD